MFRQKHAKKRSRILTPGGRGLKADALLYLLMAAACALALGGRALAVGDPGVGERKFEACAPCHTAAPGAAPDRQQAVPKLGGQHARYIVSALEAYAKGERREPAMQGIVAALADQDREDLAAYVARFELKQFPVRRSDRPATLLERKLESCRICHGAGGNSFAPVYPRLNGQDESYLLKALGDYRNGTRTNPTMAFVVKELSEKEMAELAAYYAGQREGLTHIAR